MALSECFQARLCQQRLSHRAVLQARLASTAAFGDSGYWDFALLSLYDHWMRKVVLGGLTALSELGWTERALLTSGAVFDFRPHNSPLGAVKSLGATFSHFGLKIGIIFAGLLTYWLTHTPSAVGVGGLPAAAQGLTGELASLLFPPRGGWH